MHRAIIIENIIGSKITIPINRDFLIYRNPDLFTFVNKQGLFLINDQKFFAPGKNKSALNDEQEKKDNPTRNVIKKPVNFFPKFELMRKKAQRLLSHEVNNLVHACIVDSNMACHITRVDTGKTTLFSYSFLKD